jgi:hypothetical protein
MGRQIRVEAIRKEDPDIRLYVLALIALARQIQEEDERRAAAEAQATGPATAQEASDERG